MGLLLPSFFSERQGLPSGAQAPARPFRYMPLSATALFGETERLGYTTNSTAHVIPNQLSSHANPPPIASTRRQTRMAPARTIVKNGEAAAEETKKVLFDSDIGEPLGGTPLEPVRASSAPR